MTAPLVGRGIATEDGGHTALTGQAEGPRGVGGASSRGAMGAMTEESAMAGTRRKPRPTVRAMATTPRRGKQHEVGRLTGAVGADAANRDIPRQPRAAPGPSFVPSPVRRRTVVSTGLPAEPQRTVNG